MSDCAFGQSDLRNYLHRTEPVHGGGMRGACPPLDEDPRPSR